MVITIRYAVDSNITKTNPLIRALFFEAVERDLRSLLKANPDYRYDVSHTYFYFASSDLLGTESDYSVTTKTRGCYAGIAKQACEEYLRKHITRYIRSISKFETLLDIYGCNSPNNLFSATIADEMQV